MQARQCPFYSKGNCIFSKNCSFLHLGSPPDSASDEHDSDSHSDSHSDSDPDDLGSPTIRKPYVSPAQAAPGRDSVVTVKGDWQTASPPQNGSADIAPFLSKTTPNSSSSDAPRSAISATGQELEVPILAGPLRVIPPFTLVRHSTSIELH